MSHPSASSGTSPRPKLMFFGDPHGELDFVIDAVRHHQPEAIVLLGDVQSARPLHIELAPILDLTEVWFIHGNHDTDSELDYDNLFGSELAHRNLHGRVVDVCGLRVAGLGGVFRQRVWAPPLPATRRSADDWRKVLKPRERWRDGVPLRHRSSIFPQEVDSLARQRTDVLVTHEAPSGHQYGWKALDDLAHAMGAQALVHGHHHEQIDYAAEGMLPAGCKHLAFGVGLKSFLTWPRSAITEAARGAT